MTNLASSLTEIFCDLLSLILRLVLGELYNGRIHQTVVTAPSPIHKGEVSFYFLGFQEDEKVQLKLLNFTGKEVFNQISKISEFPDRVYRTKNLKLPIGKYILEYTVEDKIQKEILFVW